MPALIVLGIMSAITIFEVKTDMPVEEGTVEVAQVQKQARAPASTGASKKGQW